MHSSLPGKRLFLATLLLAGLGVSALPAFGIDATPGGSMYENDPARAMKEGIEDSVGLYVLQPSRRHPKEKVEIPEPGTAELWLFMDPRKPDYEKEKCDALKDLLVGRFGVGGAKPFFDRFPTFKALSVVLFRVGIGHTLTPEGKYVVEKSVLAYTKLKLTRARADKLDWAAVRVQFGASTTGLTPQMGAEPKETPKPIDSAACVRNASKWADNIFFSKDYFK
jgi:hypothetical protein